LHFDLFLDFYRRKTKKKIYWKEKCRSNFTWKWDRKKLLFIWDLSEFLEEFFNTECDGYDFRLQGFQIRKNSAITVQISFRSLWLHFFFFFL